MVALTPTAKSFNNHRLAHSIPMPPRSKTVPSPFISWEADMFKKLYSWLDERLGLNNLYKATLDRPEPRGNWWNTLGSASLFLFLLQGATGIFLAVYYTP